MAVEVVRHGQRRLEAAVRPRKPPTSAERAYEIQLQLTDVLAALGGDIEYETLDISGPQYCYLAASFTPIVRSYASLTETFAKLSHQQYGASYSWITWFMAIVGRVDADGAVDLWAQNILFNAQDLEAVLFLVADEEDEAATYGWNSNANYPNTYASGAAQLPGSTRDLAKKVGDWAGQCTF